ncbi:MAG: 3-deoxy-manno-octulosonate-8-phosphatase KdsC [Pseudomonadota bacterium]
MEAVLAKARQVRLAIFDVDGVLTDGSLYLSDSGEEIKAFNSLDGHGMKMLKASGVQLAIITGRTSRCVELRAKNLGVDLLYQGVEDKLAAYRELLARLKLEPAHTAYMGDDVVDLPVLTRCGLALAVPEAPQPVQQRAHYVTRLGGGRGAVREACELILDAQGRLAAQMAAYLA